MAFAVAERMTRTEAREAMDAVVDALEEGLTAFERAKGLFLSFEKKNGHKALGYRSMSACMATELDITQRRAQQILVEMRESALLTEAVGATVVLNAREAAAVARGSNRETVSRKVINSGESVKAAVQAVTCSRFDDGYGYADEFPARSVDDDAHEHRYVCQDCGEPLGG